MNRVEYNAMRAEQKRARLSLSREVVQSRRELRKQEADQRRQQLDEQRRKAAQDKAEKNSKVQSNARALVLFMVAKNGDTIGLGALQEAWTGKGLGKSLLRTAVDQLTATGALVENRNHDSSHTVIIPRSLAAG